MLLIVEFVQKQFFAFSIVMKYFRPPTAFYFYRFSAEKLVIAVAVHAQALLGKNKKQLAVAVCVHRLLGKKR
jgi:hypothetical protein